MDETKKEENKPVRLNIKWGNKESLEKHLSKKKKEDNKDQQRGFYKPMFKTEEEEKEQLDFWMDLINETEENYEPRVPHAFLKRGQGKAVSKRSSTSKSPDKSPTKQQGPPPKVYDKGAKLSKKDKFEIFVDYMEGGPGGPYA